MSEQKEIGGPGTESVDPNDEHILENHPDENMCDCGHARWKHDKDGLCEKAKWCGCKGFTRSTMALVQTKPEHKKEYELIRQMGGLDPADWTDARILAVRQLYGKNAKNSAELALFMGIAQRHGLDPALNEIQLIPTNQGPKAYAGRDGFLKAASRQPHMYGGIESGVVYPSDVFEIVIRSETDPRTKASRRVIDIRHEFDPRTRSGRPHGAFAVVYDAHQHPTFIYRETAKCEQRKSTYWDDDHVDDAIQNRAIGAGLRRVVPLGGILIFGEEPVGSTDQIEKQVSQGTTSKLQELRAKIMDIQSGGGPAVHVDQEGRADDPEEIDELLAEFCERYRLRPDMILAWAHAVGSVPDDPDEWNLDHKTLLLQEIRDTDGLGVVKEYANTLVEAVDRSVDQRLELLTEIANAADREKLDALIARLLERRAQ